MAAAAVAEASPSNRLRLAVPEVSHTSIDITEFNDILAEAGGELSGTYGPITVLDVRTADSFPGGSIRGSVHVDFETAESDVASIISKLQDGKTRKLIVIDNGSRQQAPIIAELILAKLKSSGAAEGTEPQVYVLTSGFAGVLNENVNISADRSEVSLKSGGEKLISDFDASRWTAVAVPRTPSNANLPKSANMVLYKAAADSARVFVEAI
jgi:rhodanese-related sulfurtransferase